MQEAFPPKLLIVDDEELIREMIQDHFEPRGYKVYAVSDGVEAIDFCQKILPDIILLDIKLKRMDGNQALPKLRKIAPCAKIFVITGSEVKENLSELGADAFFDKTISILEIERIIRESLADS